MTEPLGTVVLHDGTICPIKRIRFTEGAIHYDVELAESLEGVFSYTPYRVFGDDGSLIIHACFGNVGTKRSGELWALHLYLTVEDDRRTTNARKYEEKRNSH